MKNTLKSPNLKLVFPSCGVVVAKFGFERLSGVGVWVVNPSTSGTQAIIQEEFSAGGCPVTRAH
jgi:hypothetical protein